MAGLGAGMEGALETAAKETGATPRSVASLNGGMLCGGDASRAWAAACTLADPTGGERELRLKG